MVDAILFGSIGVLAETSEIQRQAFNQSFKEHGLDWYWNIANYCELLKSPGGKRRIKDFSTVNLSDAIVESIHTRKENIFFDQLKLGHHPREGVMDCIKICRDKNIKIGFVTTTSHNNVDAIKQALHEYIDFTLFDLITTKTDVSNEKPSGDIQISHAQHRFAPRLLCDRLHRNRRCDCCGSNDHTAVEKSAYRSK